MIEISDYMTETNIEVLSKSMNNQLSELYKDLESAEKKKVKHNNISIMMEVKKHGNEFTQ